MIFTLLQVCVGATIIPTLQAPPPGLYRPRLSIMAHLYRPVKLYFSLIYQSIIAMVHCTDLLRPMENLTSVYTCEGPSKVLNSYYDALYIIRTGCQ